MDKSLRQAYDYWQDQPDNSHAMHQAFQDSDAPGVWVNTPPAPRMESRGGQRCFTPLLEAGSGKKSLPMQEFHNCQLPHGSKASRLLFGYPVLTEPSQAALMLLPFQSTDPEQCVNSQARMPQSQADRADSRRPRIPLVHQSWMAQGLRAGHRYLKLGN